MDTFYRITFWISVIMAITLIIGLILYLKNIRKDNSKVLRTLAGGVLLVLMVAIPYYIVNTTRWSPKPLNTGGDGFTYSYSEMDDSLTERYGDSLNYEHHFFNVQSFKHYMDYQRRFVNKPTSAFALDGWSRDLFVTYQGYQDSKDTLVQDVGNLFYALHSANVRGIAHHNQDRLNKIHDKEMPYFAYTQGLVHFTRSSWNHLDKAEAAYLKSIENGECLHESYEGLAELYWYFHQTEKLDDLTYSDATVDHVPLGIRRQVYFMDFDWGDYWAMMFQYEFNRWGFVAALAAGSVMILWLLFLRKLDIYEAEKWKYVVGTFAISIITMFLLYPIHDFQWGIMHYYRPFHPISDLGYMTVHIGMVEELVKILPLLIMIRFTKAVNEPFDYILYACIGALGFAFMENVHYYGNPFNVSSRGFLCYIGHMTFSATIGYGLMLAKYRGYNRYLMFGIFFLIASFMHGFYDFWLMDWWAIEYKWVSYVSVILFIQLLIYYANNTLNISNFYNPLIKLNREKLKYFGLVICVSVLMTGYLAVSYYFGYDYGHDYLIEKSTQLSFFMFFFILSLHSMKEIRGYLRPITLPLQGMFPEQKKLKDLSGLNLNLSVSRKHPIKEELFEHPEDLQQSVTLKQRLIVDDNLEAYIATLSNPIQINGIYTNQVIIIPHWFKKQFDNKKRVLANIYLMESDEIIYQPFVKEEDLVYAGRLFSEKME